MKLIEPVGQKVWHWPAVANFVLGGMGVGFYVLSPLVASWKDGAFDTRHHLLCELLAPVLVCLGFIAVAIEAGRPLRGLNLFRRLGNSWMSRETLVGGIFVCTSFLNCVFPHQVLWALAALAALGLLISQGFVVYRAKAIAAWNVPVMPLIFITSGFATGFGLMLMLAPLGCFTVSRELMLTGLICIFSSLAAWFLYLYRSHDPAFRESTEALRRPKAMLLIVGLGHVIPALLMLLLVLGMIDAFIEFQYVMALAGSTIVAGGVYQKTGIILKAGYKRQIALTCLECHMHRINSC